LACANVWMDFEDIILNEISLSKNTDILWFPLYKIPTVITFIDQKVQLLLTRARWGRKWELLLHGFASLVFNMKSFGEWVCNNMNILNTNKCTFSIIVFLVILEFELRMLYLLTKGSTTWAILPVLNVHLKKFTW
jgi:hypothetical protein